MTRLRFCLVCGTEFNVQGFDWLDDDEPIECSNCGADVYPLETLTLAERRKIERTFQIDTAQTVPVQGSFL